MSVLSEASEFTATVNQIENNEDIDDVLLNAAPQALANRTKYLNEKKAPLESPTFTGVPSVPTAPAGTNTTQAASTAFVSGKDGTATPIAAAETASVGVSVKHAREDHIHPSNLSSSTSDIKMDGTQSAGISTKPARADHVHPTDTSRAPINSPVFTGTPTAPTPPTGDSSTRVSTTEFVINNGVPAGTVIYVAKTTAPAGYLKANGTELSRSTYAALFAAIGTTFGTGDGSTTFNIPDLRGVFPRGYDDGKGLDSDRAAGEFGTYQSDGIKAHKHTLETPWVNTPDWGYGTFASGGPGGIYINTQNTGGSETRPKNVNLLACIKY